MTSESNDNGNAEEDQFADSITDEGLSPNKVFNQKPTPTTATVMDVTSTVDVRTDVVYTTIGDLNPKSDDERGAQQAEGAAGATQLSTSQTPSEMSTATARTLVAKTQSMKYYEDTKQSTGMIATAGAETSISGSKEQPANQIPKLPRGVPLTMAPQFLARSQQGSESAGPPRGARLPPLSQAEQPPPRVKVTKGANVPVIPISSIETQVCKAARLVAVELSYGGWPEAKPGACFKAAAAIEEFAKAVFFPNLLHIGQQQHDNTEASNERVFLATMLALREVLTQNAYRIFQLEDVSHDDEQQQVGDTKPGSKRQKRLDYREERQYMAQLYGTGVILASLQSLSVPESESLISSFSATMDSYDTASDEFASRMNRLDGRHQGVMLNGKTLKNEENVAWKVSYNRARKLHPVVCRNNRRLEQRSEMSHTVQIPKPNALFVSMVEESSKK